jgi:hypothetical protein
MNSNKWTPADPQRVQGVTNLMQSQGVPLAQGLNVDWTGAQAPDPFDHRNADNLIAFHPINAQRWAATRRGNIPRRGPQSADDAAFVPHTVEFGPFPGPPGSSAHQGPPAVAKQVPKTTVNSDDKGRPRGANKARSLMKHAYPCTKADRRGWSQQGIVTTRYAEQRGNKGVAETLRPAKGDCAANGLGSGSNTAAAATYARSSSNVADNAARMRLPACGDALPPAVHLFSIRPSCFAAHAAHCHHRKPPAN